MKKLVLSEPVQKALNKNLDEAFKGGGFEMFHCCREISSAIQMAFSLDDSEVAFENKEEGKKNESVVDRKKSRKCSNKSI